MLKLNCSGPVDSLQSLGSPAALLWGSESSSCYFPPFMTKTNKIITRNYSLYWYHEVPAIVSLYPGTH